jgi:peptidoglycan hydrolase-like protein with peptidoglycan-binding domain
MHKITSRALFGFLAPLSLILLVLITAATDIRVATAESSLTLGSRGADVTKLQKLLNAIGNKVSEPGKETSYFGSMTLKAVKEFQAAKGLACKNEADRTGCGLVGPKTWAMLKAFAPKANALAPAGAAISAKSKANAELAKDLEKKDPSIAVRDILARYRMGGAPGRPVPGGPGTSCTVSTAGDLAAHMNQMIDARLGAAAAPGRARSLWQDRSMTIGGTWRRNPDVWTSKGGKALDFTGVSPLNIHASNGYPNRQVGTAISPRHVALVTHYPVAIGASIVFVENNGTPHIRTLAARKAIPGTDITIGVLDSDLPDTIAFYPILDAVSLVTKMYKTDNTNPKAPIISLNQDGNVLAHGLGGIYNIGAMSGYSSHIDFWHSPYRPPTPDDNPLSNIVTSPLRVAFSGALRDGDSGNPNFMVINDELVLTGLHTSAGGGFLLAGYVNEINAAMTELGGGYQLTFADASCFDSYTLNHAPTFGARTGYMLDVETNATLFDPETGYFLLPADAVIDETTKPLIKYPAVSDVDGHRVTISVSDAANLLVANPLTNAISFREKTKYYGREIPGAVFKDTYDYMVTITDNGNPQAATTFRDGFRIAPPVETPIVIPPVVVPVKTITASVGQSSFTKTLGVNLEIPINWTASYSIDKAWIQILSASDTVLSAKGEAGLIASGKNLGGRSTIVFPNQPTGSYKIKFCEWTADAATRICGISSTFNVTVSTTPPAATTPPASTVTPAAPATPVSEPVVPPATVVIPPPPAATSRSIAVTLDASTYSRTPASTFNVTFGWTSTYPLQKLIAQIISVGEVKNTKLTTLPAIVSSGTWNISFAGYPAGDYMLKLCEWTADVATRICDSKPFTVRNEAVRSSSQTANTRGIFRTLWDWVRGR